VGLAALLPLVAFAGFALVTALGAYRAADELRLRDTARALAATVDAQIGIYVAALETLAGSLLLDGAPDAEAFAARARPIGDRLGGTIALLGLGPDYPILATTGRQPTRPLQDPLRATLAATVELGDPGISDLFEGQAILRPRLAIAVPVDRTGQPRRALALTFDPATLGALLARQNLAPGTFAAIADGQLRILAHSADPEGRRVGVQAPEWIAAAIDGRGETLIVGPGWRGPDNVYAVERLTRAPAWTVGVYERRASQQASAWAAVRWLLAGSAALGLGLAVVVWASRREALREARREADALYAGRAQVERLHGGLPALVFLREVNPDGSSRLLYRGGDHKAVMGWPSAEVSPLANFEHLIHPDDTSFAREVPALLRQGEVSYVWRARQPDGGWRTLQTLVLVLTRRPDGGAEVVGYTVDVTGRREAEARALAAARLASLGEMAAGLAHEMNQPLQAISLAADVGLIAAGRGDAVEVGRRFEQIVEQAHRTANMIDHLRRFARGVEDDTPPQPVPLAAVVEGALSLMRSALRDTSIMVEVDLDADLPVVSGHEVLLQQVLANLLMNARDALATRPAGLPRHISITAERVASNDTVRLAIADTGGGIAPEIMARLFEPFVTTKEAAKGTGLGLSICHGLIRGMGGSIEAQNTSDGARFVVTLRSLAVKEPDHVDPA
jgi:C4-dicarboxylate-specific signal transduction histidine kinase